MCSPKRKINKNDANLFHSRLSFLRHPRERYILLIPGSQHTSSHPGVLFIPSTARRTSRIISLNGAKSKMTPVIFAIAFFYFFTTRIHFSLCDICISLLYSLMALCVAGKFLLTLLWHKGYHLSLSLNLERLGNLNFAYQLLLSLMVKECFLRVCSKKKIKITAETNVF